MCVGGGEGWRGGGGGYWTGVGPSAGLVPETRLPFNDHYRSGVDRKQLSPAADRDQSSACVRSVGDVGLEWNSQPKSCSPFCRWPCGSFNSDL